MRIALLIPGLDRIGGAERQLLLLAEALSRRGISIAVVALTGSGGDAAAHLRTLGIPFLSLHMRKGVADPRGWLRFLRWLRRWRPDLLHAHLPHATWLARWSRLAQPGCVVVDTLHTTSTGNRWRRLGYRASNWLSGHVTAVSSAAAGAYLSAGLVHPGRLTVLPNGVDTARIAPGAQARSALRGKLGLGNNFLWVAAGRLEEVKNYPLLLEAMRQLPPSAHLLIAGDGPLRGGLEAMARQLSIDMRVRFLGFVPEVLPYLQAADAAVLSSRWEGLPMALLEAGACALPAVATDVPGSRAILEHGRTGLLVPFADPAALAQSMQALMDLPASHRHAMGLRARQRMETHFGLDAVLSRWEQLYAQCLPAKHSPARQMHWDFVSRF